ncbi:sepiapterin reductase [Strongylocentrotus purpuratus]|uniref:Sepiapterin reductase n=1 Tax=Strongylocentrotus purpuratus TaxID=7668 RepID=A0A7M7RHJ4_STRPU|nr:sepiapterin reductase [Strongylocentrotus purpuratus]
MASSETSSLKSFCIVTGASRGIGRAIAIALSSKFSAESHIVLTGRSVDALNETQRMVQAAAPGVQCKVVIADHSDEGNISSTLSEITKDVSPDEFQRFLLIHNAASMWDVSRYAGQSTTSDLRSLQDFCMLNITSALLLTSHYLKTFPQRNGASRTIVNISSLAALVPFPGCSVYCMGKAARHMLFRTIALEEPDVRVLNYDPGAVDTAMFRDNATNNASVDVRQMLERLENDQQLLKPDQTAAMLLSILEKDAFESGAHLSYSDDLAKTVDDFDKK